MNFTLVRACTKGAAIPLQGPSRWGRLSLGMFARVDAGLPMRSALGRPADLLSTRKDQAYAFTHALMYLTDLGSRRARLPRCQSTIAAEADAWLAANLDEPDYDLSGEILLTWPYTRRCWSASAIVGFALLASVEDRLGFLPAQPIAYGDVCFCRSSKFASRFRANVASRPYRSSSATSSRCWRMWSSG
jgi:hypothetical protein